MTEQPDIPSKLKALRKRAELSVREMARRVGMSSSGYLHYETPSRFKESVLPYPQAELFAAAMKGTPVNPLEVMRLTGEGQRVAPARAVSTGLSESATPYTFQEQPVSVGSAQPFLQALFGGRAISPASYIVTADLPAFALTAGDVVIVDMSRPPDPGELAIVSQFDDELGSSATSILRFLPPYLCGGQSSNIHPILRVNDRGVMVRYPIIGCLRGLPNK